MTKERFTNINEDIFQYGEWYCSAKSEHCADVIATALNIVTDENEQLTQSVTILDKVRNELIEEIEPFRNLARDYNIPFDKLCDTFEASLNSDTITDLETKIAKLKEENNELKSKVDDKEVAVEVETEKLMNKVFSLIDEKLGEARLAFQTKGYKSYYSGRIDALEELRKEVSE